MVARDADEAVRLTREGLDVVLVVDPRADPVPLGAAGPGRLAVLVGEPDDPDVQAAAAEMEAELFGFPRRAGAATSRPGPSRA